LFSISPHLGHSKILRPSVPLVPQAQTVIDAAESEAAADAEAAANRPPDDEGAADVDAEAEAQRKGALRKIRSARAMRVIATLSPLVSNQEAGS
jgi:hypothetical protein